MINFLSLSFCLTKKKVNKEKIKAVFYSFPMEFFILATDYRQGDLLACEELPSRFNAVASNKKPDKIRP